MDMIDASVGLCAYRHAGGMHDLSALVCGGVHTTSSFLQGRRSPSFIGARARRNVSPLRRGWPIPAEPSAASNDCADIRTCREARMIRKLKSGQYRLYSRKK